MVDEEIGRVKKSDTTDVVVRVDDFGGKRGVTIREYLTSEKYTGFTKQGVRIPAEKWEEVEGLDIYALKQAVKEAKWPKQLLEKLKEYEEVERTERIYLGRIARL